MSSSHNYIILYAKYSFFIFVKYLQKFNCCYIIQIYYIGHLRGCIKYIKLGSIVFDGAFMIKLNVIEQDVGK